MDGEAIRKRLAQIVEEKDLPMRRVSLRAGLNEHALRNILTGRTQKIDLDVLRKLLDALEIPEDRFFNRTPAAPAFASTEIYRVPVYGEIPAGHPNWNEGEVHPIDFVQGDARDMRYGAFALKVCGNSMARDFLAGDTLYLRPLNIKLGVKNPSNPVPKATFDALVGRCVAVLVNGEATLKKLEIQPEKNDYFIHLKPINPEYPVITIQETDRAEFQGEVYKIVREI